jgi:hypothetical protein
MMSDHNPYQASTIKETQSSFRPSADDVTLARYAQMLLRVVGVWLTIEGTGGMFASFVYAGMQAIILENAGVPFSLDAYGTAWFAGSCATCLGGLYLIIGGAWVLEKVFLPSSRTFASRRYEEAHEAE